MKQKDKAAKAEARANEAETLAGKGSYNSETTRVLHLKKNPLHEALVKKHSTAMEALAQEKEVRGNFVFRFSVLTPKWGQSHPTRCLPFIFATAGATGRTRNSQIKPQHQHLFFKLIIDFPKRLKKPDPVTKGLGVGRGPREKVQSVARGLLEADRPLQGVRVPAHGIQN